MRPTSYGRIRFTGEHAASNATKYISTMSDIRECFDAEDIFHKYWFYKFTLLFQ